MYDVIVSNNSAEKTIYKLCGNDRHHRLLVHHMSRVSYCRIIIPINREHTSLYSRFALFVSFAAAAPLAHGWMQLTQRGRPGGLYILLGLVPRRGLHV